MANNIGENHPVSSVEDVKGHMVEGFVHSLNGLADSTVNLYIGIIKLFFNYLEEAGYITHNPSNILRKIKVVVDDDPFESANDEKAYTDLQVLRLMRSINGKLAVRDRAIVALLSGSGLRASELCSLTIRQWHGRQNGHVYVKRKGGAMRWVAVASYVDAYMDEYLETRDTQSLNDPLIATASGKPMTRQSLYRLLTKRQREAKLPNGVHIFRHTFLTGTSKVSNDKIAQQLANHADPKTTQRYIHTTSEERIAAVNAMAWADKLEQHKQPQVSH